MKTKLLILFILFTSSIFAQQTDIKDSNFEDALIKLGYDDVIDGSVTTANISSIKTLNVSNYGIISLEGIKDFSALENLDCSDNKINELDLQDMISLVEIFCSNNQMTRFVMYDNSSLRILNISNNNIEYLLPYYYPNLEELICYNNKIIELDFSNNDNIKTLICSDNNLTSIDVKNDKNSSIESFNSKGNPDLTCIFVDNINYAKNNWEFDLTSNFVTSNSECDNYLYTSITDINFENKLINLGFDSQQDGKVLISNISKIEALDVSNSNINDLTGIEYFRSLKTLNCSNNNISILKIDSLVDLELLLCNNNNISNLDLSENSKLQQISCNDNTISNLNISTCTMLTSLVCSQNNLSNIDLSTSSRIEGLVINNNQLTSLNILNLEKLVYLNGDGNQISNIDFSLKNKLSYLSLNNNQLSNIDISNLVDIDTLKLNNNSLTNISFSANQKLRKVYINNNNISSVNLSNNINLQTIDCSYNNFTSLDFRSNTYIEDINCSNNNNLSLLDLRLKPTGVDLDASSNPNLNCIYVLNPMYSEHNWINIDSHTHFAVDENDCSNTLSESSEIEPNNSEGESTLITINSKVNGTITTDEIQDYYEIEITENGYISFSTEDNTTFETDLLFLILENNQGVKMGEYIPISIGTFHIVILRQAELTEDLSYSFKNSFNLEPTEIDSASDNYFKDAPNLSFTEVNEGVLGFYHGEVADVDIYKFVVPENGRIELTDSFEDKIGYTLTLFDEDSTEMIGSRNLNPVKIDNTTKRKVVMPPYFEKVVSSFHYLHLDKNNTYYLRISNNPYLPNHNGGKYKLQAKFYEEPRGDFSYKENQGELFFNYIPETQDNVVLEWIIKKDNNTVFTSSKKNPKYEPSSDEEVGLLTVALGIQNQGGQHIVEKEIVMGGYTDITPKAIANNGKNTLTIYNPNAKESSTVNISRAGKVIDASRVSKINGGIIEAVFFLRDEEIGEWVVTLNNEGYEPIILEDKIEVKEVNSTESGDFSIWPIQNKSYLPNRWQDFNIKYKNQGVTNLKNQQIWISITDPDKTIMKLKGGLKIEYPEYVYNNNLVEKFDSIPPYIDVEKFLGEDIPTRIYPLYIPEIKAGESGSLGFKIKSSAIDRVIINVWTYDSEFDRNSLGKAVCLNKTQGTPCAQQLLEKVATEVGNKSMPGVSCAVSVGSEVDNIVGDGDRGVGSVVYSWASIAVNCGSLAFGPAGVVVSTTWTIVSNIIDFGIIGSSCYDKKHRKSNVSVGVGSADPNSIVGPIGGGGDNNYIQTENMAYYTVNFENKSIATAPAQEIWINNDLDITKYNMSEFSFSDIVIGDSIIKIQDGSKSFIKEIDLRPSQNIIGRITGTANDNGEVRVYFRSLDSSTLDDNTNPELGILPPNNVSPEGEGSISYFVGLINPINGSIYQNKATIIFDYNDAIVTNTWTNTIDTDLPNSEIVSNNFDTEKVEISLTINGDDPLSGINDYIIFASHNGEAYTAIGRTSTNSLVYKFPTNGEYKFFSIATDKAYNIEEYKTVSEVSLIVDQLSVPDLEFNNLFKVYPNPASSVFKIESKYEIVDVSVYNASGVRVIYFKGNTTDYNINDLRGGIYIVSINTEKGIANKKLIIK